MPLQHIVTTIKERKHTSLSGTKVEIFLNGGRRILKTMVVGAFYIPKFLRRKKKRGRPRKIRQEKPVVGIDWDEWDRIKQEKYGTRYDILLLDEAPRIGSGLRTVYVKEGRKWAHMTSQTGDPSIRDGLVRKRFRIKRWEELKASHERYLIRNNKI